MILDLSVRTNFLLSFEWMVRVLAGFKKSPLAACCGGGGPYNASVGCGDRAATVCNDPSKYVCWDGIHLTEAAYKTIAQGLLGGPYTTVPITQACPRIEQSAAHSLHPIW